MHPLQYLVAFDGASRNWFVGEVSRIAPDSKIESTKAAERRVIGYRRHAIAGADAGTRA
jgi:hypothetical protein